MQVAVFYDYVAVICDMFAPRGAVANGLAGLPQYLTPRHTHKRGRVPVSEVQAVGCAAAIHGHLD